MSEKIRNVRIQSLRPIISPALLMEKYPLSVQAAQLIADARKAIAQTIHQQDDRLLVVVGPCSIHDTEAAIIKLVLWCWPTRAKSQTLVAMTSPHC